jgi:hypothetical protein
MAVTTVIKNAINHVLSGANLRVDSLAAETIETDRIERQRAIGQFDKPVFPFLDGMASFDAKPLVDSFAACRTDIERMMSGAPPGRFDRANTFYGTPDAEVLYLMIRSLAPKRIVEVGSGNSTRIIRQAIYDGQLKVNHVAVDPEPRADISGLTDRILRQRYEETDVSEELYALDVNDVLFIDSSHLVHVANDVTKLFCNAIPALRPGVAVHVHDVFLPFDYPEPFCTDYSGWGEQYLLQVMLAARPREILWPGYLVQKQRPDLRDGLPFLASGRAQSFWFRT